MNQKNAMHVAASGPLEPVVMPGAIEVHRDPIEEKLDELSDLGEYWINNRNKGRTPNAIRSALLTIANEVVLLERLSTSEAGANTLPPQQSVALRKIEDWHEDFGDCLFFHFLSFEEPPEVLFSNPISSDFGEQGEAYWTHFTILNCNDIFRQAKA